MTLYDYLKILPNEYMNITLICSQKLKKEKEIRVSFFYLRVKGLPFLNIKIPKRNRNTTYYYVNMLPKVTCLQIQINQLKNNS